MVLSLYQREVARRLNAQDRRVAGCGTLFGLRVNDNRCSNTNDSAGVVTS